MSEKDSEKRFVVMFPIHRTLNLVRGAFRAGAHDCIDKPFNTDILADVVSKQLIRETSETQIQGVDLSARIRATRSKKRKKGDDFDDNY